MTPTSWLKASVELGLVIVAVMLPILAATIQFWR